MDSLDFDMVERTLHKLVEESTETIMIEIDQDYTDSELDVIRERFFEMAQSRVLETCAALFGPLAQREQNQLPSKLKPVRRTGSNRKLMLSKDICDLYLYVNEHLDDFPRSVLSSVSFLPDVKKAKRQAVDTKAKSEQRDHIIRLESKVRQLNTKIVEVESECNKVITTQRKRIEVLETEVSNMSTILDQILLSINVPKSPTKPVIGPNNNSVLETESTPEKSVNPLSTDTNIVIIADKSPKEFVTQTGSIIGAKHQNVNKASPADDETRTEPVQFVPTYSTAVKLGTNAPAAKRHAEPPTRPHLNKATSFPKSARNTTKPLSGLKFERSRTLYVSNIRMDFDDTDTDIEDRVKRHVSSFNVNIVKINVIHNRFNKFRVGCKIDVPESNVDDAMDSENWPDPIEVRIWTRFKNRGQYTDSHPRYDQHQRDGATRTEPGATVNRTNRHPRDNYRQNSDDHDYHSYPRPDYDCDSNGDRYDDDDRQPVDRNSVRNSYDNDNTRYSRVGGTYNDYDEDAWDHRLQDNSHKYFTRYPVSTEYTDHS
ncbi:unnamed protein product [Owenia fusiformis]|uniref:Uncharacterized protein n=1 Tax=Owenia fusiformis TaxID=6347 RepID=A0A8J1TDS6_OWEFU|nr:unnamed protein product [Owenia fusiformis]